MTVVERITPVPENVALPPFPKTPEREQEEEQLIGLAKRKLWTKKGFRKATKGKGFMPKDFKTEFSDDMGGTLRVVYLRGKSEENLTVTWSGFSPNKKDSLHIQSAFIAASREPLLSNVSYTSSFYKDVNGAKIFERGTPFDLGRAENLRQIRNFFYFYL